MYDAWYQSFDDSEKPSISDADSEKIEMELASIKRNNISLSPSSFSYWKIAATFLILALASGIFYSNWSSIIDSIDPQVQAEEVTAKGAMAQLTLSDGTQVWLNSETRFRYPEKFKRGAREVYLEGEAYFEVTKDPAHPFVIHSGELSTTVLGTSFNVKAYADESTFEVAVISGNVSVEKKGYENQKIVLQPKEKAVLNKQSQQLLKQEFSNTGKYVAWKEGRIIAENLAVKDLIAILNRRYDATVVLKYESLGDCRVTAEFESMPLERVLDFLVAILNTKYSRDNGKYVIQGSRCQK